MTEPIAGSASMGGSAAAAYPAITVIDDASGSSFAATHSVGAGMIEPLDEDAAGPTDSAEEKRLKRMRRNRESAAQSRNRKKQYVEELEAQVRHLEETVSGLHSENFELRREHARLMGQPVPSAPPPLVLTPPQGYQAAVMDKLPGSCACSSESSSTKMRGLPAAVGAAEARMAPHEGRSASADPPIELDPRQASDAFLGLELLSRSASATAEAETAAAAVPSAVDSNGLTDATATAAAAAAVTSPDGNDHQSMGGQVVVAAAAATALSRAVSGFDSNYPVESASNGAMHAAQLAG